MIAKFLVGIPRYGTHATNITTRTFYDLRQGVSVIYCKNLATVYWIDCLVEMNVVALYS